MPFFPFSDFYLILSDFNGKSHMYDCDGAKDGDAE